VKILSRIGIILATILLSVTITFVLIRLMPGDPVTTLAQDIQRTQGASYADAVIRAKAMLNYDPDIPIATQYVNYISKLLQGNFGQSMYFKLPVVQIIGSGLTWTLLISTLGLALAFVIGTVAGMYIAWKRRRTILEPITSIWDAIMGAVPAFVIAYLLILLFAVHIRLFPTRGNYDVTVTPGWNPRFILSALQYAALPVISLVVTSMGMWAMGMRAASISVLGEDFILSARARGLKNSRIIGTYVGRNSLLPQITALALAFAGLFAGSTVLENLFAYPGIGYYFGKAMTNRDYSLMQALFLVITLVVVFVNQIADIVYTLVDPRLREGR